MRLVAHLAKKYQNTDYEMVELLSVGTIGLIKAVNTFRADRGSRLGTYAAKCIEKAVRMKSGCLFLCCAWRRKYLFRFSEVSCFHRFIGQQLLAGAVHGDLAGLQYITDISGVKGHIGVLLDQKESG